MTAIVSEHHAGAVLAVTVTPRAGKTGIVRIEAGAVRVTLAAAPVDGAANVALLRYLADALDRPRSSLRLLGGETSRRKRVLITGLSPAELTRRIEQITGVERA